MEALGYREALEEIKSRTNKVVLNAIEAGAVLGIHPNTARTRYRIGRGGISITELARRICKHDSESRVGDYRER